MIWLVLLIFPVIWWWCNNMYEGIYGCRLKTQYAWASHGALLFGFRLRKDWEKR